MAQHLDVADLARRLAVLLHPPVRAPLMAALALLRLGKASSMSLLQAVERKIKIATSLPEEVKERLIFELGLNLPAIRTGAVSGNRLSAKRQRREAQQLDPANNVPACRLSECPHLWHRTRDFYSQAGSQAWSEGVVPHHISDGAFISESYADVVCDFLDSDGCATKPAFIIDLGCGSGILGVRVARLLHNRGVRDVCIILADLDPSAALAQAQLPSAMELCKLGMLDVARLDADVDDGEFTMKLLLSGRTVRRGDLNSLVVLANYVFDSLPIDVFRLGPHETCEVLVPVESVGRHGGRTTGYAFQPLPPGPYFPDSPRLQALLEECLEQARVDAAEADGGAAVTVVPTGAARCLWRLHRWLQGDAVKANACTAEATTAYEAATPPHPLLLLIGDKIIPRVTATQLAAGGQATSVAVSLAKIPLFEVHGNKTFGPVSHSIVLDPLISALKLCDETHVEVLGRSPALMDFDVVGVALSFCSASGPVVLPSATPNLQSVTKGAATRSVAAAQRSFCRHFSGFGPAEMERLYAFLQLAVSERPSQVSVRMILDVIRLSKHDWHSFLGLRWPLRHRLLRSGGEGDESDEGEMDAALTVASRCYEERVAIDSSEWAESQVLFGQWLYALGAHDRAMELLNSSHGATIDEQPRVLAERHFLQGLCLLKLSHAEASDCCREHLRAAASLGHSKARRRLGRLQEEK